MYKLYYSPFSCSFAVHIALEKITEDFELEKVDVREGAHQTESFLKLNKRGRVPVLKDGEEYIDQGAGILLYLAEKHPETKIMPYLDSPLRASAISSLFYMSNTVHPTLAMAFFPDRYTHGDAKDALTKALERTKELLNELNDELEGKRFLCGEEPYAGDYYLTAILNWLQVFQIKLDDYPNLRSYKREVNDLPEVGRATGKEMKVY